jgi:hypothetical protein
MRATRYLGLTVLMVLAILATTMLVSATPVSYNVTSNFHRIDVPVGVTVTVIATTTDDSIQKVIFIWRDPTGAQAFLPDEQIASPDGSFKSEKMPNSPGEWGVQALFIGPNGKTKQGIDYVVSIKATSFFHLPEYEFGGLLAIGACFAGLVVFKKRNNLRIKIYK